MNYLSLRPLCAADTRNLPTAPACTTDSAAAANCCQPYQHALLTTVVLCTSETAAAANSRSLHQGQCTLLWLGWTKQHTWLLLLLLPSQNSPSLSLLLSARTQLNCCCCRCCCCCCDCRLQPGSLLLIWIGQTSLLLTSWQS